MTSQDLEIHEPRWEGAETWAVAQGIAKMLPCTSMSNGTLIVSSDVP